MKKYFITGLVILIPLVITIIIFILIIHLFTAPFLNLVKGYLLNYSFALHISPGIATVIARIIILICLFAFNDFKVVTSFYFLVWNLFG